MLNRDGAFIGQRPIGSKRIDHIGQMVTELLQETFLRQPRLISHFPYATHARGDVA